MISASTWLPPKAPPPLKIGNLRIQNNYPPWQPPPPGSSPDWWPANSAHAAALVSPAQLLEFGGASGGGKLLDVNEPIPTPSGFVRNGDLRTGDVVFGEDGATHKILAAHPAQEIRAFKISFDDGTFTFTHAGHLWQTFTHKERVAMVRRSESFRAKRRAGRKSRGIGAKPWLAKRNADKAALRISEPIGGKVRTTEEILETLTTLGCIRSNHAIRLTAPVQAPTQALLIDPYVLGAWLGDGTSADGAFTISDAAAPETLQHFRDAGYNLHATPSSPLRYHCYGLKRILRTLGVLNNKHVPHEYLWASPEQRLELLRGLLDTDGCCNADGQVQFWNKNERLSRAVYHLAASLGVKPFWHEARAMLYGKDCGPKYGVMWTATLACFKLEKKKSRLPLKVRSTQSWRYITNIEPVGFMRMRCITTDNPSGLYLFGKNFNITHNTNFLCADAMQEYTEPAFRGLLLRESLGEMDQIGDEMERMYLPLRARYRGRSGGGEWKFPSGARIRFGYLASDKDLSKYRGNTKSWIGIDESGLQPLHRVRAIIPWLASVDKRLRVRMRFATNPGGVGHGWQMAAFLRNRCPLHFPADPQDSNPTMTSVWPGKVYSGAAWSWPPTPSELIHKTTAFFPATVTDNPFYGQDKIDSLRSQTLELQNQLLFGCWCNAESLYFGFMRPDWMIPVQLVPDEWWWNHAISIDYGYGNSAAAAGRYSIDENGRAFGTGELVEKKMGARDFARKVADAWIKPKNGDHPQRVLFVCMDPAMDQHHDIGKSNFEIMEEVFNEYGVTCVRSHKAPADNAQNLYTGLADQNLIITTAMPQTFNSISTRVIDDRKAVRKIHGDPLDDLYDQCLAEGTLVSTERGDVPIESVTTDDRVWTRSGLQRVLWSGITSEDAALVDVKFSDGRTLTGTANHPIFVKGNGFISLDSVSYADKILTCQELVLDVSKPSFIVASHLGAIQTQPSETIGSTTARATTTDAREWMTSTGKSISTKLAQSLRAIRSTIRTRIPATTTPATSPSCLMLSTCGCTTTSTWPPMKVWLKRVNTSTLFDRLPPHGMDLKPDSHGTPKTSSIFARLSRINSMFASAVAKLSLARPWLKENTAEPTARQKHAEILDLTMRQGTAFDAEQHSSAIAIPGSVAVRVVATNFSTGRRGRVYNLSVENHEEYFANGVLVHNCAYFYNTWIAESVKPDRLKLAESLDRMREAGADATALARRSMMEMRKIEEKEAERKKGLSLRKR